MMDTLKCSTIKYNNDCLPFSFFRNILESDLSVYWFYNDDFIFKWIATEILVYNVQYDKYGTQMIFYTSYFSIS